MKENCQETVEIKMIDQIVFFLKKFIKRVNRITS